MVFRDGYVNCEAEGVSCKFHCSLSHRSSSIMYKHHVSKLKIHGSIPHDMNFQLACIALILEHFAEHFAKHFTGRPSACSAELKMLGSRGQLRLSLPAYRNQYELCEQLCLGSTTACRRIRVLLTRSGRDHNAC